MNKGFVWGVGLLCSLLLLVGAPAPALAKDKPCCVEAKKKDGWDATCNVGYFKGRKLACHNCWKLATQGGGACRRCKVAWAPGKGQLRCKGCYEMMIGKNGGWCKKHNWGWSNGVLSSCKSCLKAAAHNGWCKECKVGYVDGLKLSCKSCYKAARKRHGGWCKKCNLGYAKGQKVTCKSCLKALQKAGWCRKCNVGYGWDGTKTGCKGCWAAMRSKRGGWCKSCGIGYANGVTTKCKSCLQAAASNGWCDKCKVGYVNGEREQCKQCWDSKRHGKGPCKMHPNNK